MKQETTQTDAPKTTPIVAPNPPVPSPAVIVAAQNVAAETSAKQEYAANVAESKAIDAATQDEAPAYLAELSPTAPIDRAGLLDKMHSDASTMAAYGQALARAAALAGLSEEWVSKPDDTPASILARIDERIITNATGEERFEELKKLTEDSVVVARARNLALAYEVRGTLFGEGRKYATFGAWSISHRQHGIASEDYARRLALAGLAPSALLLLKAYGTAPIMKLSATTQEAMETQAADWVTRMKGATGLLRTMSGVKAMALLCPPEPKNAPTVEPPKAKDNNKAPDAEKPAAAPAVTPPSFAQIADVNACAKDILEAALRERLALCIPTPDDLTRFAASFARLEREGKPGAAAELAVSAYQSIAGFVTMLGNFGGNLSQSGAVKVEREKEQSGALTMCATARKAYKPVSVK